MPKRPSPAAAGAGAVPRHQHRCEQHVGVAHVQPAAAAARGRVALDHITANNGKIGRDLVDHNNLVDLVHFADQSILLSLLLLSILTTSLTTSALSTR